MPARDPRRDGRQRVLLAMKRPELLVDRAHEGVEVDPRLPAVRQRGVESIHEEALSPSDAAPEVDAARCWGRTDPAQDRMARASEGEELVIEALQPQERALLCRIEHDAAPSELRLEVAAERAFGGGGLRSGMRGGVVQARVADAGRIRD